MMEEDAVKFRPFGLIFGLLFFFSLSSYSQEKSEVIRFEIQVLGLKIGDMNVSKYQVADTVHYVAESQVKFWFFGTVNLTMNTHSKYLNGYLVKSHSKSNTNRGNFASYIYWDGKKYVVDAKSYKFENQDPVFGLAEWCSTRMFFDELQVGEKFLSEVYGLATTVKKLGPNVYQTTIAGNENRYFYKFGKLQKVEQENNIKNFTYKRIE
ncbi:DUF6134 family protein [Algoriphagus sp. AK58]|uniref:DUF6134 family protein n=1 Tax=Algoriphagus sp. AK58 TaxID=1406877 RepID=UPI001650D194|nr:DUF6134 family protein [Algoriphagus sp. AK58]MBC6366072.1 hypothetical protein [Algoriphagus sp. AK58]